MRPTHCRMGWIAIVTLVLLSGCGGPRLDMPPAVSSADEEYVCIDNATLEDVDGKQVVRIRMSVYKDLPSDLVYDLLAGEGGADVIIQQNVPTGIKRDEPGGRTIDIPVHEAMDGGKILFHLIEVPASQPGQ